MQADDDCIYHLVLNSIIQNETNLCEKVVSMTYAVSNLMYSIYSLFSTGQHYELPFSMKLPYLLAYLFMFILYHD